MLDAFKKGHVESEDLLALAAIFAVPGWHININARDIIAKEQPPTEMTLYVDTGKQIPEHLRVRAQALLEKLYDTKWEFSAITTTRGETPHKVLHSVVPTTRVEEVCNDFDQYRPVPVTKESEATKAAPSSPEAQMRRSYEQKTDAEFSEPRTQHAGKGGHAAPYDGGPPQSQAHPETRRQIPFEMLVTHDDALEPLVQPRVDIFSPDFAATLKAAVVPVSSWARRMHREVAEGLQNRLNTQTAAADVKPLGDEGVEIKRVAPRVDSVDAQHHVKGGPDITPVV